VQSGQLGSMHLLSQKVKFSSGRPHSSQLRGKIDMFLYLKKLLFIETTTCSSNKSLSYNSIKKLQ